MTAVDARETSASPCNLIKASHVRSSTRGTDVRLRRRQSNVNLIIVIKSLKITLTVFNVRATIEKYIFIKKFAYVVITYNRTYRTSYQSVKMIETFTKTRLKDRTAPFFKGKLRPPKLPSIVVCTFIRVHAAQTECYITKWNNITRVCFDIATPLSQASLPSAEVA